MRALMLSVLVAFAGLTAGAEEVPELTDAQFSAKLKEMYSRIEKSSKILREQIVQNQSAPFLADLYLQLGDLLSEKSTALYYLQMERDHNTGDKTVASKKFSPVVKAQLEAIQIYEQILKEFPKFDKTDKVLYRLATAQKSIDEGPAFVKTAEKLIASFPDTKETIQIRLLLGQYYYDMQAMKDARQQLDIVAQSTYPYERNAARYRIGLIYLGDEKHSEALKQFEQVALDKELQEEQNPIELSLKTRAPKSTVKREALIDSVRAYTEVYKDNADPVAYYAKITPSETLFQEVIEKLSFRYIFLKRYDAAIRLLRVLSERVADPQRVMNIYQQVLVMIPVSDRLDVPVAEMAYVLDKYNDWSNHYALPPEMKRVTHEFFEKQIRELGTRSHDLAKKASEPRKGQLFERARTYYHLYLGYFGYGPKAVKIATNLADVYYNQRNFFQSGSYYLRVFSGEFGTPTHKEDLIQNAILSLQKPSDYAYYEQLRAKGMMVKAIDSYMALVPAKRNDQQLRFARSKAFYEQGYYDRAIDDLYNVVKQFPHSKEAKDAVDLILSYYNTRSDFKGLAVWSKKLQAVAGLDSDVQRRLKDVYSKSQLRRLEEQVKTQKDYDVAAQSKSYLEAALSLDDRGMRSVALQQALGLSKAERDIDTFLKTARTMAKAEKDKKKRAEILNSMASELLAITRFYEADRIYQQIAGDDSLAEDARVAAYEKSVKVMAMLRDSDRLAALLSKRMAKQINSQTRESAEQQLLGLVDNPIVLSSPVQNYLIENSSDDLLPLYKAQLRLSKSQRSALLAKVNRSCAGKSNQPVCQWIRWSEARTAVHGFESAMSKAPTKMEAIEPAANKMAGLLEFTRTYSGSGIAQLDLLVTMANAKIYSSFAGFLERTAKANKDLMQILMAKAQESTDAAKKSVAQCQRVLQVSKLENTNLRSLCGDGRTLASVESTLDNTARYTLTSPGADPSSTALVEQQKQLFAKRDDWKSYLTVSEGYLRDGKWHHAAAAAALGRSVFPQSAEEFNAVMGCALIPMGILNEAKFVLNKASDINNHRTQCLEKLKVAR